MKKVLLGIARFLYVTIMASFIIAAIESIANWFKELRMAVQKIQSKVELIEIHQEVDRDVVLYPMMKDVEQIKKKVEEF